MQMWISTLVKLKPAHSACAGYAEGGKTNKVSPAMASAEAEICDGLDNDCNMTADDGLTPPEADNLKVLCG